MGKKRLLLVSISIIVLLIISIVLYKSRVYCNVYYRVYTQEDGWSSWCKNGKVCGDDHEIKAYEVKIKSNTKGRVFYESYQVDGWNEYPKADGETSGNKKDNIKSIRMELTDTLRKKYIIYYRYTSKDKWSSWRANYTYPKTTKKSKPIKKIQIEIKKGVQL